MKAIVHYEYGSSDVIRLIETEKPRPNDDEVLVKIHAASINSADWRHLRAVPFLIRTDSGLLKPKDPRLGADFAGTVEAVGKNVTQFKPGDEVFGEVATGGYAEYVCTTEKNLALKPANVSFEVAAATPMAALTSLQGLRDKGKIQGGQKVLVNGASGGVGSFAVLLAKYFGAEVTGVCSTRNLEVVRSLGADHVIDYTKEDFSKNGKQYDLIFDVASNHSVFAYKRALTPNGKYVLAGFTTLLHMAHILLLGPRVARNGQEIGMMGMASMSNTDLVFIGGLLESSKIAPFIDGTYPLSETANAFRYYENEHPQGKIVIKVI